MTVGSSTGTFPNSVGDAALALRELSQPWTMGDRIKSAIERAARQSGLAYWRAFQIWYGKARRPKGLEPARTSAGLDNTHEQSARDVTNPPRSTRTQRA